MVVRMFHRTAAAALWRTAGPALVPFVLGRENLRRSRGISMNIEAMVERVLDEQGDGEFDPSSLGLEFEKAGDAAFDAVRRRLAHGQLSGEGQVRGLRMLALLCRQFCVARKPELLELAIGAGMSSSARVRSEAVHIAILTASGMRDLAMFAGLVSERAVQRVKRVLPGALAAGVDPDVEALARSFMEVDV
jgi:hypothetical protein